MTPLSRDRKLEWLPVEKIIPNDNNPRKEPSFTPQQLATLRDSIDEHGILQPVIVAPYKGDTYELIDGERRLTTAKLSKLKEIPAVIVSKMDDHSQVVTMFNIHTQHRAWEMAEQLAAIKRLVEKNGHKSHTEVAKELGISLATFKDRLRVLAMGDGVVSEIVKGDVDYSSVLRVDQVTDTLKKHRPALVEKLGGEDAVEKKLISKAKARKGISQELVEIRRDFAEVGQLSDAAVEKYISEPKATKGDMRRQESSLEERRKTEGLVKEVRRVEMEIRRFKIDLAEVPNLRQLQKSVSSLVDAAQELEDRIFSVLLKEDEPVG